MIAVIDYGRGNLHSVEKACAAQSAREVRIISSPRELSSAEGVIIPGVGAFGDAMAALRASGMDRALVEAAHRGVPFLGICLGMQILLEEGEEFGHHEGLGLIPGRCLRLEESEGHKVPHIGWNEVSTHDCVEDKLFTGIPQGTHFYFVHSYYADVDAHYRTATFPFRQPHTAAIRKDNVAGVQFHPEKSSRWGMEVFKNFVALVEEG